MKPRNSKIELKAPRGTPAFVNPAETSRLTANQSNPAFRKPDEANQPAGTVCEILHDLMDEDGDFRGYPGNN